ncbi:MAG: shikimate kinase [Balneolaceae bacterium]
MQKSSTSRSGQAIFLCGMMGAGKTTVGKSLAAKLSLPFVDLDDEITKQEGCSIPDLFAEKGEKYFRKIEREILEQKSEGLNGVMALGGGALRNQEVIRRLKSIGRLIFLDAPLSVLSERLKNDGNRPLLNETDDEKTEKKIRDLLTERRPFYSQSHITIQTGRRQPAEIVNIILEKIQNHER